MSVAIIPQMDRVWDLVTQLLEEGEDPREIKDTVKDAIREWRQRRAPETAPASEPQTSRDAKPKEERE